MFSNRLRVGPNVTAGRALPYMLDLPARNSSAGRLPSMSGDEVSEA